MKKNRPRVKAITEIRSRTTLILPGQLGTDITTKQDPLTRIQWDNDRATYVSKGDTEEIKD